MPVYRLTTINIQLIKYRELINFKTQKTISFLKKCTNPSDRTITAATFLVQIIDNYV